MSSEKQRQERTEQQGGRQSSRSGQAGPKAMPRGGSSEGKNPPAKPAPHNARDNSDFLVYPTNKVVGFIDDVDDAKAALRDLKVAGFTAAQIGVLTGKEGAHRIDVKGDEHGRLAHIVRSVQKLLGDYEIEHAAREEQELLAGHFGIGVIAHDEEDREKVRQILKAHNGHFINFYGRWAMENMDP